MSVTGIGGIGKTRLAWELEKYLDGLVEPIWWHEGRSPAYGEGITFWALGEMVRRRAGLVETDDERTTRTKIAETVAAHVPELDERRWVEPALLTLLGIDAGAVDPAQLFGAWRMFFERLAATGTVVMVFEDLQWADPGLLDFIDALLEWSRSFPIFVLTLARPELLERRPDWGAGKRSFTSIFLEPLPAAAMRDLLAGLVAGLPDAAVTAIVERADGVPLYAVETVRMLLAEGKLAIQGGVYRPVGDLTTLAVPATLTALIASRLDGLEPHDRSLLCDAAVLGQSFTLAGLAAVSGIPEPELEPRLRALVRRELLTLETDPRSPERGQYASSRPWSGRSPTTRSPGATARAGTSPPPASSRASGPMRLRAPLPATTSPPTGTRPRGRRPTPSLFRPASRSGRLPSGPSRWAPMHRRSPS